MSLVEMICEELGVEIGEIWKANDGGNYSIDQSGRLTVYVLTSENEYSDVYEEDIQKVLAGEIRPRWIPLEGEKYYTPNPAYFTEEFRFTEREWIDTMFDREALKNNMIFKTPEAAIAVANKMLDAVKGEI